MGIAILGEHRDGRPGAQGRNIAAGHTTHYNDQQGPYEGKTSHPANLQRILKAGPGICEAELHLRAGVVHQLARRLFTGFTMAARMAW